VNRVDTIFGAGLDALLFFLQRLCSGFSITRCAAVMNHIELSFELAAARCDDFTLRVYRRLHRAHPETLAMFRSEGSELVKGSMLALTIEAILDFAGERRGKFRLIECEVVSHDAYGTSRDLFIAFFGIIADTLREVLGADWSDEIDTAWKNLLAEIGQIVVRQMAQ
jgi:hemoglobin-like flavoprotein